MIRRGTTPTHTFTLPLEPRFIKKMEIVYAQNGVEVFHKDMEDCTFEGKIAVVRLTQEETLSLKEDRDVHLQLRVLADDDSALVSNIVTTTVRRALKDEVML